MRCERCLHPDPARRPQPREDWDEEVGDHPLHGWPNLARLMTVNADLQAFPAFTELNLKSLLYYQAELTDLKHELRQREWEDHISGDFYDAKLFAERVDVLLRSRDREISSQSRQWDLMVRIRQVLNDYSKIYFNISF